MQISLNKLILINQSYPNSRNMNAFTRQFNMHFSESLSWLMSIYLYLRFKKQNPFWSNFIKLATVSERQAPPIHARPNNPGKNRGSLSLRNCVCKKIVRLNWVELNCIVRLIVLYCIIDCIVRLSLRNCVCKKIVRLNLLIYDLKFWLFEWREENVVVEQLIWLGLTNSFGYDVENDILF